MAFQIGLLFDRACVLSCEVGKPYHSYKTIKIYVSKYIIIHQKVSAKLQIYTSNKLMTKQRKDEMIVKLVTTELEVVDEKQEEKRGKSI